MFVLAPLRRGPIALFWGGQFLAATGDDMYRVVVAWLAASLAGAAAGWLWSAQSFTILVVSLLAGVLVDRWDSRRTLIGAAAARAAVMVVVPALSLAGLFQYWHLWIVVIGFACLRAIELPAQQAILPRLAPGPATLLALNGLIDTTRRLSRIAGPGLAAAVAIVLPVEDALLVVALALALAAAATAVLRPSVRRRRAGGRGGVAGLVAEFLDGVRAVAGNRVTSWAMVGITLTNVVWANAFLLGFVLLSQERFPGDVAAYGLIVAAYGAGNVVATLIVGSLSYARQARCLFAGRIVLGLGFAAVALAPDLPLMMAGSAFAALGGPMADLAFVAIMQRAFPPSRIGRVYGLRVTADALGGFAGALVSAPLLAWWSPAAVTAASGLLLALFGAAALVWGPAAGRSPQPQGVPADD